MRRLTETCVRVFCLPGRREELLGDLAELRSEQGASTIVVRDLVSVCFFQSRLGGWRAREWACAGLAVGLAAALFGAGAIGAVRADDVHSINARDAAGVFSLEIEGGRVRSATMDGLPFPLDRIERVDDRLLLETGDPARDLSIQLFADGAIEWEGRDGRSGGEQEAPIELDWARDYLQEARRVGSEDGGALWGVNLHGPTLLVDRESRFVVANVADADGVLEKRDGLWIGELPRDQNIANTAVDWAGRRWTMVIWPLPSDRYARRKLVFHELFHRVQPELGIPSRDVVNDHLGTRDGRIWLRLEWRALAEALVRRGDDRRDAIVDALAFRARRHALFPGAAASERALELNEGLSEYTGLVMSGLPPQVLADRAAVELGRRERQESYTRSFAYASGPAYCLLLDESGVEWRGGVDAETDLARVLAKALAIEVADAGAESRAAPYAAARIIAQEELRSERMTAAEAELRTRFLERPTLTAPVAGSFRYSFDPNAATPLPGAGTVYDTARVTDEWGILEVSANGVLLVRGDTGITQVVVPLAAGGPAAPTAGNGWTLDLSEPWRLAPDSRAGSWVIERRD